MKDKRGQFFKKNRRGQGLSVNAIILIVIGVIVLVILVLGFTIGWNKLLPLVASNNVQAIKTTCILACSTGNEFDFCTQERTLRADGLPMGIDGKVPKEVQSTCNFFSAALDYEKFGIEACSSITCTGQ